MKKEYKVMVADIDGTLVSKGEDLMPITKEAIIQLHQQGVKFGVASGRPIDQRIADKAKHWELGFEFDFMIGMNGGELWEKERPQIQKYHLLPTDTMRKILRFMTTLDVNCIVFADGYNHVKALRMDEFLIDSQKRNQSKVTIGDVDDLCQQPCGKLEFHYRPEMEEEVFQLIKAHQSPQWIAVKTFLGTVEFQDPHVQKGLALEIYAKNQQIALQDIIAFGDMDNDIGLLKTAGYGVCLKNGSQGTKAVADAITEYDVTQDGVGKYIFEHVL